MKTTLALLSIATLTGAFQVPPQPTSRAVTSSTSLYGGFLEGKGKRITVREDEDNAMWFDDGQGGAVQAEPKKPAGKGKEAPKEPKKGGFKFPWDK